MLKLEIEGVEDFITFVNYIRNPNAQEAIKEITEKLKKANTALETAVEENKNGESRSQ